jgi:hypothetical protein
MNIKTYLLFINIYCLAHVCNLKEFKVYGGLDPHDMNELLHKGLTDDNKPETFSIRYTFNDLVSLFMPFCVFMQITAY